MAEFVLTPRQQEAQEVLNGPAKHIMLAGGSRCVAGDTVLDGQFLTIKELAELGAHVWVRTSRGKQLADPPFLKGRARLLKITLQSGRSVTVTPDHRFWTGDAWRVASDLRCSDLLAVRRTSPDLQKSSSECAPSTWREDARRLRGRLEDLTDRCFSHLRRYGQRLLRVEASFPVFGASQSCAQARIHLDQCLGNPAFALPESNIRRAQRPLRVEVDSLIDLSLSRRPTKDGSPSSCLQAGSCTRASARTSELSRGSHSKRLRSGRLSGLWRSARQRAGAVRYQFSRFFGLSYDVPCLSGYELDKVKIISLTAEQEFYTLHVPVTEQYFANGILHHNSGKTLLIVRKIVQRALKAPGSRHAILRFRLGHVKQSIVHDTFPTVMAKAFKGIDFDLNKGELYATFPGGSEIWFGGLDDKERVEKILGNEYASIFLNECSQISYGARNMAITRLAQNVHDRATGKPLKVKMYYDENPPDKGHWTYRMFKLFEDPESRQPLDREDHAFFQINPGDNQVNLSEDYLKTLRALPERLRKRFLYGEFRDSSPNALFSDEHIERWRVIDTALPDMLRVVVAVDPSGADDTDNMENDEIGIVVCGLGIDGNGYVLEDLTCKTGPAGWGRVATQAFERHRADRIVAEVNYGGAMVRAVIHSARPRTPFRPVTASRGKAVRAEPISTLVETGKVRFAGIFRELEDELCGFTTHGYMGENSPNRADAMIWAFSDLFPELTLPEDKPVPPPPQFINRGNKNSWMRR